MHVSFSPVALNGGKWKLDDLDSIIKTEIQWPLILCVESASSDVLQCVGRRSGTGW